MQYRSGAVQLGPSGDYNGIVFYFARSRVTKRDYLGWPKSLRIQEYQQMRNSRRNETKQNNIISPLLLKLRRLRRPPHLEMRFNHAMAMLGCIRWLLKFHISESAGRTNRRWKCTKVHWARIAPGKITSAGLADTSLELEITIPRRWKLAKPVVWYEMQQRYRWKLRRHVRCRAVCWCCSRSIWSLLRPLRYHLTRPRYLKKVPRSDYHG